MNKYWILIILNILISCKEKVTFKEIILNENILKEIKLDHKVSDTPNVYIVSLFTDNQENICEIVKHQESPTSTNFVGFQVLEKDTIFLYTDKKYKYQNCYSLSGKTINLNKKQFAIENRNEIGYYKIDTITCSIRKFTPNKEKTIIQ
ncbi:hypothetical protein P2W68_04050 [Chryseobacterium arthrosphaerae]|uniref:hypothetical protein n=1 Tax=Chryseobacterium arthrosphaerae TaxID=651561 RepID=UPI0023E21DB6|nr:hypothetical protein [Chryseobacterium arthrosphaerae]WES98786.1 hypothetical protein P2W68_04050 [Chryseobacterium arthrosphaerae]